MEGFFTKKETSSEKITKKSLSCVSCGLYKNVEHPKMEAHGKGSKGIICIGSFPTKWDDRKGKQWQGKTGRFLGNTLEDLGIDLFEDCININSVNCRTPKDRKPTNHEISCCRKVKVNKILKEEQPKLILLFGKEAVYSFLGKRWKESLDTMERWRGFIIPDQDYKAWVCPVFSPDYVEQAEDEVVFNIWKYDLNKALSHLDKEFPKFVEPKVKIIKDLSILNKLNSSMIAIDIETTGLKPYEKHHKIVCAAVAPNENEAFAFMIPKKVKEKKPLKYLMQNPVITKIGYNIKYEHQWFKKKFINTNCEGWEWDGMLAAHIIENRSKVSGLKFQTYVNFGIIDYASEIKPYLHSIDGTSNGVNTVLELIKKPGGKKKLLTYCAWDAVLEYRMALLQMKTIDYDYLPF